MGVFGTSLQNVQKHLQFLCSVLCSIVCIVLSAVTGPKMMTVIGWPNLYLYTSLIIYAIAHSSVTGKRISINNLCAINSSSFLRNDQLFFCFTL